MGWNRSGTILSVISFLAFGFMVIGVFSDPLSKDMLSIASKDGYSYGILGQCQDKDGSYDCTKYDIGYSLHGSSWPANAETITKAFIVHIIAAGLLLISLLLALLCHLRIPGLWITAGVVLGLGFVASTLAFALEIYVFKLNLRFAGWFGLAAAILSLLGTAGMGIMYRNLVSSLGETDVRDNGDGFLSDPANFKDDNLAFEKGDLLKAPSMVTAYPVGGGGSIGGGPKSTAGGPKSTVGGPKSTVGSGYAPSKNLGSQRGYERIPENPSNSDLSLKSRAHPLPLPISKSSDSIGAVSRSQQQLPSRGAERSGPMGAYGKDASSYARDLSKGSSYVGAGGAGAAHSAGSAGAAGAAGAGAGAGAAGAAGAAGLGGSAAGFGGMAGRPGNPERTKRWEPTNNAVPRGERQDTWSQVALKKSQEQKPTHNYASSIASSQAPHIPAGQYLGGVDKSEGFGPNVVQIPKIRQGTAPAGESATIDYAKDETQVKSPLGPSKVPNYSRMSSQEQSPTKAKAADKPSTASPQKAAPAAASAAPPTSASAAPPTSASAAAAAQAAAPLQSNHTGTTTQYDQSQYGYGQYDPSQYGANPYGYSQYAQYPGGYGYTGYEQPAYGGYGYDYSGYNMGYAAQPAYYASSGYAPANYGQSGYGMSTPPRRAPAQAKPQKQTSDVVLSSNPDFSVGGMGRKRRPGRP